MLLEIACFSLDGVANALTAGANRLELCENPEAGGTTPSHGFLKQARTMASLPLFPIIRPRGGDFVYTSAEFETMKYDLMLCKSMGFDGVVLGLLLANGMVDEQRTAALVGWAYPLEVTFHRAFDRCPQPFQAIQQLINLGISRILTSGGQPTAAEGADAIASYVDAADHRLVVMPGGGINSKNILQLAQTTKAVEYHAACRKMKTSSLPGYTSADPINGQFATVDVEEASALKELLSRPAAQFV
jgi:copper homeostasis protein